MTFREKFEKECGTVFWSGCPHDHGYEERPSFYTHCAYTTCEACWSREIEEEEQKPMKHKVGDTVLVQAKIVLVDEDEREFLIEVADPYGGKKWVRFADVFELPKPEKTYEQGLQDAWGLLRRLVENTNPSKLIDMGKFFGVSSIVDILDKYTPQEALAKLKAYEEAQEIKVGDVVEFKDGTKGIVMDTDTDDSLALFTENGCVEAWINKEHVKKTGKHIDIAGLLEQIKGDANE